MPWQHEKDSHLAASPLPYASLCRALPVECVSLEDVSHSTKKTSRSCGVSPCSRPLASAAPSSATMARAQDANLRGTVLHRPAIWHCSPGNAQETRGPKNSADGLPLYVKRCANTKSMIVS